MDIIFISGVELGWYAFRGILASEACLKGDINIKAIFSLSHKKKDYTSGYKNFDDLATLANIPLIRIYSVKSNSVIQQIKKYQPDFIFIIGWSELAPYEILNIPMLKHESIKRHASTHGCIGMHPTLLPIGRGRAPIPWAIIKGMKKSGVTMFYLEETADSGDIIVQQEFRIDIEDDASSVYKKVANLHYSIVKNTIGSIKNGSNARIIQDSNKATIWKKRTSEDGIINWNKLQGEQYNWVRALTHPYPGAFTFWRGEKLIIWKAKLYKGSIKGNPGTILDIIDNSLLVGCLDSPLLIEKLQLHDGPKLSAQDFVNYYSLKVGESFFNSNRNFKSYFPHKKNFCFRYLL